MKMIRFIDGPANGVGLSLQRMVMFLRVVRDSKGKWDALDQPDDRPAADETIYVYRHDKTTGSAFVDGRDPKTGKRWGRVENIATYRFHDVQPTDAEMRGQAAWETWCWAQPEAERFKPKGIK
jgi:hypothetical protein